MDTQRKLLGTSLALIAVGVLSLAGGRASATLTLFPGTGSDVIDNVGGGGGPDLDGTVDVILAQNVPVPGAPGVEFSGEVIYTFTTWWAGPNLVHDHTLTITNAMLTNATASPVGLTGAPVEWAKKNYGPPAVGGLGVIDAIINGSLHELNALPVPNISQELRIGVAATTFWGDPSPGIPPGLPVLADWINTSPPLVSIPMAAASSFTADFSGDPGDFIVTLRGLRLGPNEEMLLPTSVDGHAAIGIPEPGTLTLLSVSVLGVITRRR